MLLIFEGCDKSGKTTMMKEVASLLNCEVLEKDRKRIPVLGSAGERSGLKLKYEKILVHAESSSAPFVLVDRFYPSELVYSKVKRKYEAFDDKWYKDFEKKVYNIPHLMLYCYAAPSIIRKRMKLEMETDISAGQVTSVLTRYIKFLNSTKLNHVCVDTEVRPEHSLRTILTAIADTYVDSRIESIWK